MNLAVLVVDLLEDIEDSRGRGYSCGQESPEKALHDIDQVLEAANAVGVPIFATRYDGLKIVRKVQSYAGHHEVIDKSERDAFINTDLEDRLQQKEIDTLVVIGYDRDICILNTIKTARRKGYNVITSEALMFAEGSRIARAARGQSRKKSMDFIRSNTLYCDDVDGIFAYFPNN